MDQALGVNWQALTKPPKQSLSPDLKTTLAQDATFLIRKAEQ